jgi:hypothetical protein
MMPDSMMPGSMMPGSMMPDSLPTLPQTPRRTA